MGSDATGGWGGMSMTHSAVSGYVRGLYAGLLTVGLASVAAASPLRREDLQWLARVTYGPNGATVAQYQQLGRRRFLDAQLAATDAGLPPAIEQQVETLEIAHRDGRQLLASVNETNQQINALTDEPARQAARKTLNDQGNQLAYEAQRRLLLYALYSPAQLREQMVWFWLNHFSVFQYKGNLRWLVADYEATAIRPFALGHFRDLVLATLKHPAMLQYLDNAQNAVGHVNENYARELMELHTLGVDAGYTQQDVQELARILTGVGINATDNVPKLGTEARRRYVHQGAFEFNPARHDPGHKQLLGQGFDGGGLDEVEAAIDELVAQPACARHISHQLAVYFLGREPPPTLLEHLAREFRRSHGDITAVLRLLLNSREFTASLGKALKDPMHFVVSAVRLAYDDKPIVNTHPLVNWLAVLGEPLFGRQTPDGYPLDEAGWASSGQLSRRFEIARAIAAGNAGLFAPEDGSAATVTGFPQIAGHVYYDTLEPLLSATTRQALDQASSQVEWNTYVLSSPEFNDR
jgi:uncharacterized protein (DUF1800 family)